MYLWLVWDQDNKSCPVELELGEDTSIGIEKQLPHIFLKVIIAQHGTGLGLSSEHGFPWFQLGGGLKGFFPW